MKVIKIEEVEQYVEKNIYQFHERRLQNLANTNLKNLLKRKNPYLFKAKNLVTAQELIGSFLDAKLSSSEEEIFGEFLEDLAIFVAQKTLNAVKSGMKGIDLEFTERGRRILISIKSGPNWGNTGQWGDLVLSFQRAIKVLKQNKNVGMVECILGECYGKSKARTKKGIMTEICGQEFWHMISGKKFFYKDILEPIGHNAKKHNDEFKEKKAQLINRLTGEFLAEFCDEDGKILWDEVVEYNSGNIDSTPNR